MRCRNDPGISVVVTLFNYSNFIMDCIRSFRNQSVTFPVELIIVDDGSTDGGLSKAKFASSQPGHAIKIVELHKNYGYAKAKNLGLENSNFNIVKMLDADDMLVDGCLQNAWEVFSQHNFDFLHGPCFKLIEQNDMWTNVGTHQSWERWHKEKDGNSPWLGVHAQGTFYKKNIHSKIGLYDENMKSKADREMWARMHSNNIVLHSVDFHVAFYRQHNLQMSRSKQKLKNKTKIESYFNRVYHERMNKNFYGLKMLDV